MSEVHTRRESRVLRSIGEAVERRREARTDRAETPTVAEVLRARRRTAPDAPAPTTRTATEALRDLTRDGDPSGALARIARANGHTGAPRLDGTTIGTTTTQES